jgi:hypothetical protein
MQRRLASGVHQDNKRFPMLSDLQQATNEVVAIELLLPSARAFFLPLALISPKRS